MTPLLLMRHFLFVFIVEEYENDVLNELMFSYEEGSVQCTNILRAVVVIKSVQVLNRRILCLIALII